jgi:predicted ATPase
VLTPPDAYAPAPARLARAASEASSLGQDYGFPLATAIGSLAQGWLLATAGEHGAGIAAMKGGVDAFRATGHLVSLPGLSTILASAYTRAGDIEAAQELIAEARAFVDRTGEVRFQPELHRVEGELHLARGERRGGERALHRAAEIAHEQGARWWELRASISLARLFQQQRKRVAALRILEPLARSFTEGLDTPDVQAASVLLSELR